MRLARGAHIGFTFYERVRIKRREERRETEAAHTNVAVRKSRMASDFGRSVPPGGGKEDRKKERRRSTRRYRRTIIVFRPLPQRISRPPRESREANFCVIMSCDLTRARLTTRLMMPLLVAGRPSKSCSAQVMADIWFIALALQAFTLVEPYECATSKLCSLTWFGPRRALDAPPLS